MLCFMMFVYCINMLFLIMQVPITLLEYSMNAVTEGIDAIASTRVLIRGEDDHAITNGSIGPTLHRTFRCEIYLKYCLPLSLSVLSCRIGEHGHDSESEISVLMEHFPKYDTVWK